MIAMVRDARAALAVPRAVIGAGAGLDIFAFGFHFESPPNLFLGYFSGERACFDPSSTVPGALEGE